MAEDKAKPIKILIVDDSEFMRMIIKGMLQKANFTEFLTASTGNDAVEICKLSSPDIILLDINMEDGDGINTLRQVRSINPNIKCIMVSAVDQKEMFEETKKLGAVDFIKKPFHADRLIKAVNDAINESNQTGA